MAFNIHIGDQTNTLSGFSTQPVWNGALRGPLPGCITDVWLVVHDSISLDVDFRYLNAGVDSGSHAGVSINPDLVLPNGSHVRGWHATYDRTLHDGLTVNRVTPVTGTYNFTLWVSGPGDPCYCTYGGRVKPDVPDLVVLATDNLLSIVSAVKANWFMTAASFFLGKGLNVADLCAANRVAAPSFGLADVWALISGTDPPQHEAILTKAWNWLQWAAWPLYCECVPGTPLPAPYPEDDTPLPPGLDPGPAVPLVCDVADVCTQIEKMLLAINAIAQKLNAVSTTVNLIQRQKAPVLYVFGATHGPLSGSGTFAVAGILGLSLEFSAWPAWLGRTADVPTNLWTLGYISLGTPEGWESRIPINHAEQMVLDVSLLITRVGYHFEPGCTVTITEVIRTQ